MLLEILDEADVVLMRQTIVSLLELIDKMRVERKSLISNNNFIKSVHRDEVINLRNQIKQITDELKVYQVST
jgi:hypothetical protein